MFGFIQVYIGQCNPHPRGKEKVLSVESEIMPFVLNLEDLELLITFHSNGLLKARHCLNIWKLRHCNVHLLIKLKLKN